MATLVIAPWDYGICGYITCMGHGASWAESVRLGGKVGDSSLERVWPSWAGNWVLCCFSFRWNFCCLFPPHVFTLVIFPCFIVEIKLIGFAFEKGEENREVKECAMNGMLVIKPGNTGGKGRLGKLGKYHSVHYWVTELEGSRAIYIGVPSRQLEAQVLSLGKKSGLKIHVFLPHRVHCSVSENGWGLAFIYSSFHSF